MSGGVRDRAPAWLLAAVVLLAALALLFVRAARRGDFASELSSYGAHPKGTRALFLLWGAQGILAERRHLDLEGIEHTGALVLLVPAAEVEPREDRSTEDGGAGGDEAGPDDSAEENGEAEDGEAEDGEAEDGEAEDGEAEDGEAEDHGGHDHAARDHAGHDHAAEDDLAGHDPAAEDAPAGNDPAEDDPAAEGTEDPEDDPSGDDSLPGFLAPPGPGKYERRALLAWVEKGNTLFLGTARELPLLSDLGVGWEPREGALPTLAHPVVPTPFTAGVRNVHGTAAATLSVRSGAAVPLLADGQGPVALLLRRGHGQVIVTSAPDLLRNDRIALADNARLAASLGLALARSGLVQVDEFHHGFRAGRSLAGFAIRHELHWSALQALLACALFVLATRRFGAPLLGRREERRATADFLLAMARIYQRGGHAGAAGAALRRAAVARAARRAGLPAHTPVETIAARLTERGLAELGRALLSFDAAAASLLRGNPGERELLDLARRAASLRAAASPITPAARRRTDDRRNAARSTPGQ